VEDCREPSFWEMDAWAEEKEFTMNVFDWCALELIIWWED